MSGWPYNTTQWRKLRAVKLMASPLCEMCDRQGRVKVAEAVDHIKPINQGGDPFPPLDGLMALCSRHHNEKTAAHDRQGGNVTGRRFKGVDANGDPLDPLDGWHGGGASDHENRGDRKPMAPSRKDIISKPNGSGWVY